MKKETMENKPNKTIEDELIGKKVWLECTTLNILPGESVSISLEEEDNHDIQPNREQIFTSFTVNEEGKGLVLVDSKAFNENREQIEEFSENIKETNIQSGAVLNGYWSIDEYGECKINGALPEMLVYFILETKGIEDGTEIAIDVFYDDLENEDNENGDEGFDKWVEEGRQYQTIRGEVTENKVSFPVVLTDLANVLGNKLGTTLKLFSKCCYGEEEYIFPDKEKEFLEVKYIVIDRYKMPGLNKNGTDIADDLTYGTGSPRICLDEKGKEVDCQIYDKRKVKEYIIEYGDYGFDHEKHFSFVNKEEIVEEISIESKPKNIEKKNIISDLVKSRNIKMDNTRVFNEKKYEDVQALINFKKEKARINKKARYSLERIKNVTYDVSFKIPRINEEISFGIDTTDDINKFISLSDEELFEIFTYYAEFFFARGELQGNINRMIKKFQNNTGGIYEDIVLNKYIKESPSTKRYCMYMENYIAERIKEEGFQNVFEIEDIKPEFEKDLRDRRTKGKIKGDDILDKDGDEVPITRPSYSYGGLSITKPLKTIEEIWGAGEGLTIALNDIWSTQVSLLEMKNDGVNYEIKYEVILWDQFGLDLPDLQKIFNLMPKIRLTFLSWFILQHLRGYKPFVTKISFVKTFKGNTNEGREDRRKNMKDKELALIKAEKSKILEKKYNEAITPWPQGGLKW